MKPRKVNQRGRSNEKHLESSDIGIGARRNDEQHSERW